MAPSVFGLVLQVCGDDTDDGLADLAVVLPEAVGVLNALYLRTCAPRVVGQVAAAVLGVVRETEVTAEHVDALLPAAGVRTLIGHAGHGVDTGDAHRHVLVPELGSSGTEAFHEAALFGVALPPVCHHEGDGAADPGNPGQRRPSDLDSGRLLDLQTGELPDGPVE